MSQLYFNTTHKGFPITVTLGWDRPLQYFFLVISKPIELIDGPLQDEGDHFLYSSLHEVEPFGYGLDYDREVLRHFQIVVPESMFIEVRNVAAKNIGNHLAKHQADGSFTEREL